MKNNILFLTHFYFPETGAASVRVQSFVSALKNTESSVKVVTPIPNYPQGKVYPGYDKFYYKDNGNNITYLPILFKKNKSVIGRLFSYLSYVMTSFFYGILIKYKADYVISSSPPIFTSFVGLVVAKSKRAKFVLDIRDIWPDIGVQLKIVKSKFGLFFLKRIENILLKYSDRIIVTTEGDKKNLVQKATNADKIDIIYNGADTELFSPKTEIQSQDIRRKYNLPIDKKILIYFGSFNLGMNDIEILGATLVDLENEVDDFHFVSIGEGNLKPRFLDQIKNVNFTEFPSVSTLEVSEIVSASDLVVIPRKKIKTDTGGNVPVKCYESLAAGIPFVLTVNEEDESSKLFGDKEFAKLVSTDDKNILKSAILEMLKRTDLRELGLKGREFVVKNFDRKKQSEKLIKIIEEIGKS